MDTNSPDRTAAAADSYNHPAGFNGPPQFQPRNQSHAHFAQQPSQFWLNPNLSTEANSRNVFNPTLQCPLLPLPLSRIPFGHSNPEVCPIDIAQEIRSTPHLDISLFHPTYPSFPTITIIPPNKVPRPLTHLHLPHKAD